MLKERLLTALLAGVALLVGLWFLNTIGVAVLLGVVTLLAAFEWAALVGLGSRTRLVFVVLILFLGLASLRLSLSAVILAAIVWWVWAAGEVFVFRDQVSPLWRYAPVKYLSGALVLVPAWRGCVALKSQDPSRPALLIWLLIMVWTADSVAYFAGRALGRHRLAPRVSPGKSVEGALAGIMGAAAAGGIGALWVGVSGLTVGTGLVLGVAIAMASIVGDLLESKAKRLAAVKDSGRLLPGHGGILDRIDALTAAIPLFVWTMRYLGVR
ncbi:phosphatidate cytidylyltransferase [Acidiferrobacter sp.]|uniref:phosphatidate cytidylyltransferase n=1 Tax=Acidiferrobacter sp. TaxID=1872107 RepID=UPI002619CDA3|nr:phosphatidate cytidylyltransferase [Acidiferrobacter sp.]